jgi:hypothetical protein
MRFRPVIALLVSSAFVVLGCSKDSGTGPDDVSCRTFPTTVTQVVTTGSSQTNIAGTCFFNQATNQLSCSYASGATACYTQLQTFSSAADFVDEVAVVPPIKRLNSEVITNQSACGPPSRTTLFTYDGQRRLMRTVEQVTNGTNTYTAWDSSGRPTAGANPGPPAATYTYAYSDANRTETFTTAVTSGLNITTTTTYSADGIVTNINNAIANGATTTYVITPAGTAKVCK